MNFINSYTYSTVTQELNMMQALLHLFSIFKITILSRFQLYAIHASLADISLSYRAFTTLCGFCNWVLENATYMNAIAN